MKRFLSQIFALICIVVIVYASLSLRPYVITGDSMDPALSAGDIIIIDRFLDTWYPLKRGDIIVYSDITSAEKIKIKRIIWLWNETINIHDGKIYRNDEQEEMYETYLGQHIKTCVPGSCIDLKNKSYTIPTGHYFVLGDNRENSVDSRGCVDATKCDISEVKYIPEKEIIGRMIMKF